VYSHRVIERARVLILRGLIAGIEATLQVTRLTLYSPPDRPYSDTFGGWKEQHGSTKILGQCHSRRSLDGGSTVRADKPSEQR
jgi:hypothetical protein